MSDYSKIMVPIDSSEVSLLSIRHAITMAKAFHSSVLVVYVDDPYPFTGAGPDLAFGQAEFVEQSSEIAKENLEEASGLLKAAGVQTRTLMLAGSNVQNTIIDAVHEYGINLIIMASHARSKLEKFLLGSTAERLVSAARVPVMVVHQNSEVEPEQAPATAKPAEPAA